VRCRAQCRRRFTAVRGIDGRRKRSKRHGAKLEVVQGRKWRTVSDIAQCGAEQTARCNGAFCCRIRAGLCRRTANGTHACGYYRFNVWPRLTTSEKSALARAVSVAKYARKRSRNSHTRSRSARERSASSSLRNVQLEKHRPNLRCDDVSSREVTLREDKRPCFLLRDFCSSSGRLRARRLWKHRARIRPSSRKRIPLFITNLSRSFRSHRKIVRGEYVEAWYFLP